jgi:hypothetical protein
MQYLKLREVLDNAILLKEEKEMWLRLGIYIGTESFYSSDISRTAIRLYDGLGNEAHLPVIMARNIRTQILDWWEVERVKPRAREVSVDETGLMQLENRNAT